jgi:hypothetical protein
VRLDRDKESDYSVSRQASRIVGAEDVDEWWRVAYRRVWLYADERAR